ncbi:Uncharacterised protein [Vibrio cholerae]|nr:Uncharacterised protein [Vibrio cholerae]
MLSAGSLLPSGSSLTAGVKLMYGETNFSTTSSRTSFPAM